MPPPDRAAAHAAAQALGLPLSDGQADQLLGHLKLLQQWNAAYNLTAVRDPAAMWLQHVVDCMAAVPALTRALPSFCAGTTRPRVLDVGSGAGLPGVVWAVLLPQLDVTCIDTVGKKVAFIRQVSGALQLGNLQVRHARVEQLREPPFHLITSRAFASLADFTRLTLHLLAPQGRWLAMKGKAPTDELAELGWPATMFHVEPLAVPGLQAERCLVWLKNDTPTTPMAG
ncbi:16S rRNA (guanine(527)-N(7))-methyltransferase RsmG [Pseudorhodoferax sp.]|uniref:16S rRNA (guanine(527)-N(7))-methyltransferase RsmG n=1 Tax=Pseudorhodoferax sp. TaxID=1993553 RepID=UPI002DD62B08|nr:16S rRNA (guanine(527)-N(7))-methyltransferase RsmG [Pseudorhodoferax sp.]